MKLQDATLQALKERSIHAYLARLLWQYLAQTYRTRSSTFQRERQYDPFRAKEIINLGILPQETSQICI